MIEVNLEKKISPQDVAQYVAISNDTEQALFFEALGCAVDHFDWCRQCACIANEFDNNFGDRHLQQTINALETLAGHLKLIKENNK